MHHDQHPGVQSAALPNGAHAAKFDVRTIIIALRCWWKVSVPAGVLLAAATGSLVYYLFEPTYTASTWLFIQERPEQLLPTAGEDSRRFVDNQIELMKSPLLLGPIAAKKEIRSAPELIRALDPYVELSKRLKIAARGQSEYFVIEFSSKDPQKAALIVKEVTQAFLSTHRKNEAARTRIMLTKLVEYERQQSQHAVNLLEEARSLAKSLNLPDPTNRLAAPKQAVDDPLADIQARLLDEDGKAFELKLELQTAEEFFKKNPVEVSPRELAQALAADPELASLQAELKGIDDKLTDYDQRAAKGYKTKLPAYNLLVHQRQTVSEELKSKTESTRQELTEKIEKDIANQREQELTELSAALSLAEQKVARLTETRNQALNSRRESNGSQLDLTSKLSEYERAQELLLLAQRQINAIESNSYFNSERVQWPDQNVLTPSRPDEVVPVKKIAMFAGAAFLIPLVLAVAWEHFFRRVNSRQQLESHGALKVVGEITALPRRTRRGAGAKVSRDLQLFEESVDGLRTYLSLVDNLEGARVLAVTSAISREGKTSVAAQLAVSLAGATGEPTLLIDGDLRSPDVHRVFGVDLGPGLADVLTGELADDEAIETDFNQTLHLMTAGKLSSSPHRLLGSGEFRALIDRLRGIYRYIIIDTPPLLAASEALILARTADAAILSARRDYSRLDQVTEASVRLRSAGVAFAGVVLNGIPIRHYAYKYGSYSYRRQLTAAE